MELNMALAISARGMDVQTNRLRVIAENLANQDTTGSQPSGKPYQRKTITFSNQFDRALGTNAVCKTACKTFQIPEVNSVQ